MYEIACAHRDPARVIEALESAAPAIPRLGSSNAQDDIFGLALLRSPREAGHRESIAELQAPFSGKRPASALA